MSAAGLPGTAGGGPAAGDRQPAEGGQHRRGASAVVAQRLGLGLLLAGIAAATVAVPPLITPDREAAPERAAAIPAVIASPSPPVSVPASSSPSATEKTSATPKTSENPGKTAKPGPVTCAPVVKGGSVEVTTRPSCGIYDGSLGNGWAATGDGMKVMPGEVVHETREPAMRVERTRPALDETAMALTPATPVGLRPGDKLRLRIRGGREYGTVLRLTVAPSGTGRVTLTAPPEKWTTFTVALDELTARDRLTRIDLEIADDQVPNVNNFFLDDIAITR